MALIPIVVGCKTKKYAELSTAEKIQADCDMKATNIILQGLPADIYSLERECKLYDAFDKFTHIKGESLHNVPPKWSMFVTDVKLVKDLHTTNFDQLHAYLEQHELLANEVRLLRERNQDPLAFSQVNHQTSSVPQIAYQSPQFSTQPITESPLLDLGFAVLVFSPEDDLIACLNKAMDFLTVVASSSNATSFGGNNASGQERVVKCYNCQDEEQLAFLADPGVPDGQAVQTIIPNNAAFQTEDLDTYDSDCDEISNAKAVLMANISKYGSNVISDVPHSETYLNDMENQSVHAMQDFKQTPAVDFIDNEIHNDSNIILYS
ncbi:hypothetical protein Tco_0273106 [Tanacetum coccineum]